MSYNCIFYILIRITPFAFPVFLLHLPFINVFYGSQDAYIKNRYVSLNGQSIKEELSAVTI
jgi:hypothetical protein